mgnify:CR=1 FL=1
MDHDIGHLKRQDLSFSQWHHRSSTKLDIHNKYVHMPSILVVCDILLLNNKRIQNIHLMF